MNDGLFKVILGYSRIKEYPEGLEIGPAVLELPAGDRNATVKIRRIPPLRILPLIRIIFDEKVKLKTD